MSSMLSIVRVFPGDIGIDDDPIRESRLTLAPPPCGDRMRGQTSRSKTIFGPRRNAVPGAGGHVGTRTAKWSRPCLREDARRIPARGIAAVRWHYDLPSALSMQRSRELSLTGLVKKPRAPPLSAAAR